MIMGNISAQNWREIKSVSDVCSHYPKEMEKMLEEFNLNYPGMERVKEAKASGDLEEACRQLLAYYTRSDNAARLRREQPRQSNRTEALADTILKNVFVIQNVRGEVPWGDDGHRDWYYKGPNDDHEWAWLSNRHSQLYNVLGTYFKTGNPKYAMYIDEFLRDFIIKSMPYPGVKSRTSVWRGLEVHARAKRWTEIFYGLLNSDYLLPATRLLMLSSLADHAHYNRNFHAENNWLTMEISALATVATHFPEYKNSAEWFDYSVEVMVESMKGQVYPDGVQTELTSHYHITSLSNFELFKDICDQVNRELPEYYTRTIMDMNDYLAKTMRPNGTGILNNDGDLDNNRNRILNAAARHGKSDWEYIASNGQKGDKPVEGPSYFFPWAGQLISRSGFDPDAHWSFFDIGPWGSGHQHNDKLHISISAYGRDLLVDAGRFAYTGEVAKKFRPYATGSQGHNVLLIDGNGQGPGPLLSTEPVPENQWYISDGYDYAKGSFNSFKNTEGVVNHTRHVYYSRGDFWVVIDEIATDRPRKIEALWHWHPSCMVAQDGERVFTENDRGNLQIIPLGDQKREITFVKGQETPEIQGWYSPAYNDFEPNITSIFTWSIESNDRIAWVIIPSEKVEKGFKAEMVDDSLNEITIRVVNNRNKESLVTIPLSLATVIGCGHSKPNVPITGEEQHFIIERATASLDSLPVTVTAEVCERSAGSLNDFYSEGDYWWPDPDNPEGPYIRRDGETNPDNFTFHRLAMIRLSQIVGMQTSAYLLTGEQKFADGVAKHLDAWFVNPDTRMNPSMNYAQAIKGRVTGRGIGIIDAIHLIEVARSVELLSKNSVLPERIRVGTIAWFNDFVTWLTTHPYGIDEMNTKNNHATCWVMQVGAFARLTDNAEVMELCRKRFKEVLLPDQMAEDGSFPLELERTKPYGYSLFNLDAMFTTAEILSDESNDLYAYTTTDGKSLLSGAEFLYPYVKDKSSWPYGEDVMYWNEWPVRHPFLLFAGRAYNKPEYIQLWEVLDGYPESQEVIRNMPIRNPLVWVIEEPIR